MNKIKSWREGLAEYQPDLVEVVPDVQVETTKTETKSNGAKRKPIVFDLDNGNGVENVESVENVDNKNDEKPKRKPIVFDLEKSDNDDPNEIDIMDADPDDLIVLDEIHDQSFGAANMAAASKPEKIVDLRTKMSNKKKPPTVHHSTRARSRTRSPRRRSRRSRSSSSDSGSRRNRHHRHRRTRSRSRSRSRSRTPGRGSDSRLVKFCH